jgi:hypothetical protein
MFTKYSVEGPILSIQDKDGIENKEPVTDDVDERKNYVVVCKKCGLQHLFLNDEKERTCICGYFMRLE